VTKARLYSLIISALPLALCFAKLAPALLHPGGMNDGGYW
jgi:hypothetical protein